MKRIICVVLCLLLCISTTACKEETGMARDVEYRVLFIGNSYTYYNDMWDLFTNAGESLGYTITADHVTQGGYYLDQYLNTKDEFGIKMLQCFAKNSYDAVFIQEQSTCAIQNYDRYEAAVKALDDQIRANGAKTILYQTWGRQEGSPTLLALGWTNKSMTEDLIAAYDRAADTIGAAVSPVGAAFYDVYTAHSDIELYDPDTTHPSLAGSYLAALCHLATFTGADVREVTYDAGLGDETASVLREAAYAAVFAA